MIFRHIESNDYYKDYLTLYNLKTLLIISPTNILLLLKIIIKLLDQELC